MKLFNTCMFFYVLGVLVGNVQGGFITPIALSIGWGGMLAFLLLFFIIKDKWWENERNRTKRG